MKRLITLFNLVRKDVLVILFALINSRTPKAFRVAIVAVLLYLVSPVDILPDYIPFAGLLDDMVLVPSLLTAIRKSLPEEVVESAEHKAGRYSKYLPILGIAATVLLVLWTIIVIVGVYKLFFS